MNLIWSIYKFLAVTFVLWFSKSLFSGPDTVTEDLGEILVGLVIGILIALTLLFNKTLQYIRNNHDMVRREWRLLDALSTDFQNAYRSVEQINQNANQVWDSGVLNLRLITQTLTEAETRWVKEIGDLSFEAKRCTEDFLEVNRNDYGSVAFARSIQARNLIPLELDLAFGVKRAKSAIRKYRREKGIEYAKESVRLLEDSRARVRRLQDRPIDTIDHHRRRQASFVNIHTWQPFRSGLALVLLRLVNSEESFAHGMEREIRAVVMQLQLLRALVKDLRAVTLESQIEKVWLDEANEVVGQAQKEITAFLLQVARRVRWLSMVTHLRYRCKFKKVMKRVGELLTHLLETKESYGFNFVKRDLSEVSLPMDDRDGNIAIRAISRSRSAVLRELLDQELRGSFDGPKSVIEVLGELDSLRKLLIEEEETDGGTHTRAVCFNLLQKMYSNMESCVTRERWDGVERIKDSASLLTKCMHVYRIKTMQESCAAVGLEEAKHELVTKLTGNFDRCRPIISIVGMRGVGKTTLAKEMCNHKLVVENFDSRCLVTLPEEVGNNELELLQIVGNQVLQFQNQETRNEREFWIGRLQQLLSDRKILIVLNNLSTKEAWDTLKPGLIPQGTISAIMITTRYVEVASHANPIFIHHHRLLTADESWEFFTQMVDPPSDLNVMKLAKKVVARTGGLPLAIVRLGYLLSGKKVTRDDFSVLLERVWQGQNQRPWEANLDTNIQELQNQSVLDNCLSYFQLFPIDYKIPTRRLIAMWIAQEIIPAQNTHGANESDFAVIEEKAAREYLSDLINRNMIQVVEQRNGKFLTCQFPGILRNLWSRRRRNNGMARSWGCASIGRQTAYNFLDGNEDESYSRIIHNLDGNALREDNYPLSVTFFDGREGNGPGKDVHNFLVRGISSGNFKGLLVLDLERVFRPQLHRNVGTLRQLKYLGLRWTFVETLPASIGELSNLQTLDLKKTSIRTLPRSVWKLKKLRHLHLNQCRINDLPPHIDISMKNLHKLSGVFVDNESGALMDNLHKLSNLRKLRLTFQLTESQQDRLSRNLQRLTCLRSLSLRSVNESSEPQDLKLEHLSNLQNLSSLYLFGKLENLCVISELPWSLTDLTLSGSQLSQGSIILQMLAARPQLKFLSFFSRSFVGNELVFPRVGFPKLIDLKLWNLENLEKLEFEEEAMPELREFEIRECRNLAATTEGLTHLSSLKHLKLTDMSPEYTKFVENDFARAKRRNPERIFPTIRINNEQPVVQ